MNKLKRIGTILAMTFISIYTNAQSITAPEKDVMRSNGKIFVVMAVVIIVMIGFFIYLINIDRKLGKLENKL